ncbi:MAG TPA: DNA polymerase III subunit delta [Bryobacteraceae bacterium]|nr:DNA polymerase III subunit delta [Bryobacteraceae bacterium]
MTPEQFLATLRSRPPEPVYLFIGPEQYTRDRCRRALIAKALPAEQRADGVTRHDLSEVDLIEVLDDARSLSLFAAERVIWAASAEAAVPRENASDNAAAEALEAYLAEPVPGVVVVLDSSRYDFEGDDKVRTQRVQKFFSGVRAQVEFMRLDAIAARRIAQSLARETGLRIGDAELDLLVDVLDADATRIATEIEKLATYAGPGRAIAAEDIWTLVPNARATTIFALVAALGRRDRTRSLDLLDILAREGEYLPLALSFLGGQFRLALAAKEAGLANASQIQAHFAKQGMQVWRGRAEQIQQTVSAFSVDKLREGLQRIYETDKALRDTRPDDRTVMEQFVLSLT